MLELVKKYEKGYFSEAENITVKEYLIKWLYEYKNNDVSKKHLLIIKLLLIIILCHTLVN